MTKKSETKGHCSLFQSHIYKLESQDLKTGVPDYKAYELFFSYYILTIGGNLFPQAYCPLRP